MARLTRSSDGRPSGQPIWLVHPENSTDDAARFHELLDGVLDKIDYLLEAGLVDGSLASQHQQRVRTLRYQVRQLRGALPAARSDLLSGLEISWGEFERCFRKLEQQKTYDEERRTHEEQRAPQSGESRSVE